MKIRLASEIQTDSIVDGEGIRTVIWTQGCSHNCPGCHNPETHDFNSGILTDTDEVINKLEGLELQDGITFSGGDPMMQPEACSIIAKRCKELGYNIWCYTGFTYEQLLDNPKRVEFLKYIDCLVDGRFMIDKKSYDCLFRGSTNQRIIDVQKSLKQNKTVVMKKYDKKIKSLKTLPIW